MPPGSSLRSDPGTRTPSGLIVHLGILCPSPPFRDEDKNLFEAGARTQGLHMECAMEPTYEILLLSDLFKKSRQKPHPDFESAASYILRRLTTAQAHPASQFNKTFGRIAGFLPINIWIRLLYHMRYDAMMAFCREENRREIYGMISFQKHPSRGKIGMFDIYVSPERRSKDLLGNFSAMAELVYRLCERFLSKGYYIQCGNNETTRRILRLYQRLAEKNKWELFVDVELARIYLGG